MANPRPTSPLPGGSGLQRADLPIAPHLQIWRWTVTMATSILQRATGIAMYGGTILLSLWLASAAWSDGAYNAVQGFMGSWFGMLILFGYTWAISFHMLNGIKYLAADSGAGLEKAAMNRNAWLVFIGSAVLTVLIWAGVFLTKGAGS